MPPPFFQSEPSCTTIPAVDREQVLEMLQRMQELLHNELFPLASSLSSALDAENLGKPELDVVLKRVDASIRDLENELQRYRTS